MHNKTSPTRSRIRFAGLWLCAVAVMVVSPRHAVANEPLAAILQAKCVRCHGEKQPQAGLDLRRLEATTTPAEQLQRVLAAIDANDMPPETEPQLTPSERESLLTTLKAMRQVALRDQQRPASRLHRLTRFQYNNAVQDLFQLNRDVFELPEKLLTRRDRYVPSSTDKMPDRVQVASHALRPAPGLAGVKPFPKDLRAEHGFDNQADKLTLSPLLLDAFLRLGGSIVESDDFNPQTVGIWNDFFREPTDPRANDPAAEIERRLKPFLRSAFRGPVDEPTLRRYVSYTTAKLDRGVSFTESMKKASAAVLCSPKFLYRAPAADERERQFELASKLSFFLWASIPDAELLDLAERGHLSRPHDLRRTVDRMVADPKIERFLDTFPAQWLQLENVLAVTPDPKKARYFRLDETHPASLQMVIEPLLLFDAVFIENRPLVDLIAPSFGYRSDFLRDWYESDLKPPTVDVEAIAAKHRQVETRRRELEQKIAEARAAAELIVKPVREKLLAERQSQNKDVPPLDLKPVAAWEFNGDLKDSLGTLDLTAHGDVKLADGNVVLDRAYLQSSPLKTDLKAKSLEVWCELPDVKQRGGGLMSIEGPGAVFDSIVLGERQPQHWISGSDHFARTEDFPESTPETAVGERLHLVMVYEAEGATRLYRNGVPYGKPFHKSLFKFPREKTSVLFGLRHLPAGGNKYLSVRIDKARLYDRALTADEVTASARGFGFTIPEAEVVAALKEADLITLRGARKRLADAEAELARTPPPQPAQAQIAQAREQAARRFEDVLRDKLHSPVFQRVPLTDPRYGGVITNAAVLSMTSGPLRTQPIARGSWIVEVIFNDPPPPPPNNVPPLKEDNTATLTIREQFAAHRENPSCAGCHAKIDPLGFALENFDITGRWRDNYENGRPVDASGTLLRKYNFSSAVDFKASLVKEQPRFARAFTSHLLRFAVARELAPVDTLTLDEILSRAEADGFRLRDLLRDVALHLR